MVDDAELAGLDPFDIMDEEAARLDAHLSGLADDEWSRPSRCEGWSVRDVVAHLATVEDYHRACLDGEVQAFVAGFGERGATDLESANALGIADRADLTTADLVAAWRGSSAENRARFRERGEGVLDTLAGEYPNRWQSFHVATELATHADDIGVPESADERARRYVWRVPFSRFTLAEAKPDLAVTVDGDHTRISGDGSDLTVDDVELVEGVAGRLGDTARLDAASCDILSATP